VPRWKAGPKQPVLRKKHARVSGEKKLLARKIIPLKEIGSAFGGTAIGRAFSKGKAARGGGPVPPEGGRKPTAPGGGRVPRGPVGTDFLSRKTFTGGPGGAPVRGGAGYLPRAGVSFKGGNGGALAATRGGPPPAGGIRPRGEIFFAGGVKNGGGGLQERCRALPQGGRGGRPCSGPR